MFFLLCFDFCCVVKKDDLSESEGDDVVAEDGLAEGDGSLRYRQREMGGIKRRLDTEDGRRRQIKAMKLEHISLSSMANALNKDTKHSQHKATELNP